MSPEDQGKKLSQLITKSEVKFSEGIDSSETSIFNSILAETKELDIDRNGNVKQTAKNLKVVRSISKKLRSLIVTPAYEKKVNSYIKSFTDIEKTNNEYLEQFEGFNPDKAIYAGVKESSLLSVEASLLHSGVDDAMVTPIREILTRNVTTGGSISDFQDELRLFIKGDPERLGKLERYTTQIVNDALNQYSANQLLTVSEDLKIKWYKYVGTTKDTTRKFCKQRVGKYWTKCEIERWGSPTKAPKTWSGRIPTTNKTNIFTYRGGYNCNHQFIPVLEAVVPSKQVERARIAKCL